MAIGWKILLITWVLSVASATFAASISLAVAESQSDTTLTEQDTMPKKRGFLHTAGNAWKTLVLSAPQDFVQMGHSVKENWGRTAAYVAGTSLVILADKPVTKWYQDKLERHIDYNLPKLPGSTGNQFFRGNDAYLNYSIIGLYGGSLLANYGTGQRAALNSLKALGYSYLFVHVGLKALFARQRPDPTLSDGIAPTPPNTGSPYEFFHFRKLNYGTGPDGTSFPSFHATAYYAVAKVMAMEFDNYWIPYGAVTFIFFADLDSHRHWVGDMIAGGLLGTLIGKGIVNSSRRFEKRQKARQSGIPHKKESRTNYAVLPVVSSSMTGLSLHVQL